MKNKIIFVLSFFIIISLFFSKNVYADMSIFPSTKEEYKKSVNQSILMNDTTEFTFCGKDGYAEIDIKSIKNTIESETDLVTNKDDGVVYISTENGFILKVDDIKAPVPKETVLCEFPDLRFTDIAVDENKVVYVTTRFELYTLDVETCELTLVPDIHSDYRANALSFDTDGNLYYGGSGDGATLVYRYDQNEASEAYVWHDFGEGTAAGDFVILNGKMYVAWRLNNNNSGVHLYEVEVDSDFNYVSHVDLGALDSSTFGLASENGELYGIASHNMYKISLSPFSENQVFWNGTSSVHGQWWGAAGLHEAQNLNISIYESIDDLTNEENELPDDWINTEVDEQVLHVRVEDEETGDFEIKEITIIIVEAPNPGEDTVIDVCSDDSIDLFSELGALAETVGVWTDPNGDVFGTNHTVSFNPLTNLFGEYTYTITTLHCKESAVINVRNTIDFNTGLPNSITLCSQEKSINLFDVLEGNPDVDGVWRDPNGAFFGSDDQGKLDPSVSGVLSGDYEYVLFSAECNIEVSTKVNVTIESLPVAAMENITICEGGGVQNLLNLISTVVSPDGSWLAPDGTTLGNNDQGEFDPSKDAAGEYSYIEKDACGPQLVVTVVLGLQISSGTSSSVNLCVTDNAINLFDELGGSPDSGGVWTDPNGIPYGTDEQGRLDPSISGVLSGNYTYTVSTTACPIPSETIIKVLINETPNLGIDASLTICTGGAIFNLFDELGGTPDIGGIWKDPNGAEYGNDHLGIFDPSLTTNKYGVYSYSISTDFCEEVFSTVEVTLGDAPNSGTTTNLELCTTNSVINLFDELGDSPDSGGVWTDPNGTTFGTNDQGSLDPSAVGVLSGDYTYTISTSSCPDPVSTIVKVDISEAPNLGTDASLTICTGGAIFNLFNELGGTPDTGGIWKDPNGVVYGNDHLGFFDPSLTTNEYGVYSYSISTNFCEEVFSTVEVTLGDAPNSGTTTNVELCTTDNAVNLFDELGGSPDSGGVWTDPNGVIFGTNDQGSIDPSVVGVLSGEYTYTISTNTCPDPSSTIVKVDVIQAPNMGIDASLTVCTSGATFNLFDELGGTPDIGGIWKDPNGVVYGNDHLGSFNPSLATNEYGAYSYSISTNFCEEVFSTVEVTLGDAPNSGTTTNVELCTTDNAVNLFDELGGSPDSGGVWTDPNGVIFGTNDQGSIDPSVVGVLSGEYTYTVSTSTCPDPSSTIVKVDIATTPEIALVDQTISENLSTYDISFVTNGTWNISVSPNVGQIDIPNSKITEIPYGTDVIITAENPFNTSCFGHLFVETPVFVCPIIEVPTNPSNETICYGNTIPELSVQVNIQEGESANWYNEVGELVLLNSTTFTPNENDIIPGDYTFFVERVNSSGLCFSEEIPVYLSVKEIPQITLVAEGTICVETDGTILSGSEAYIDSTLPNDGSYIFEWKLNGQIITEQTEATITVFEPGDYQLSYTNSEVDSCSNTVSASIQAFSVPEKLDLELSAGIFSDNNNLIATVTGGTGNFEYSLDGGEYQESNIFRNISLGEHTVTAIDIDGCGEPITGTKFVMGFPAFFTPNGDNIHDTWNVSIDNSDTTFDMNIFIYDRFGKLVKQIFSYEEGWDGTHEGKNMPSDDYWFIVTINNTSETYSSHFTLLR